MSRPWRAAAAFGACLLLGAAGLGYLTTVVLRLDRAEAEARAKAAREEAARLALWRVDYALAPLLAREGARPYFHYKAFYPAGRAYTRMYAELPRGAATLPSPLLTEQTPLIRLHFQRHPDGSYTSPQAPVGNQRDLAEGKFVPSERVITATARLRAFEQTAEAVGLVALLDGHAHAKPAERPAPPPVVPNNALPFLNQGVLELKEQRGRTQNELAKRRQSLPYGERRQEMFAFPAKQEARDDVAEGPFVPLWVGPELAVARAVAIAGERYVQGFVLDWPALAAEQAARVADLLPGARLEPDTDGADGDGHPLASLPARLVVADAPPPAAGSSPGVLPLLLTAWGVFAAAALAVGYLLLAAVRLSERRGAFVAAVTHELRTPLTSFRLYADLLAAAPASPSAGVYAETLQREGERVAHLVENVFALSRLERGRTLAPRETVTAAALVEALRPVVRPRLGAAGLSYEEDLPDDLCGRLVAVDLAAVQQIAANLADNAAKYARAGRPSVFQLSAAVRGRRLRLRFRDHGPGLPKRRVFGRAFSKTVEQAARSAPGIGLGLALSRRLARALGGSLRPVRPADGGPGAALELSLPLVRP